MKSFYLFIGELLYLLGYPFMRLFRNLFVGSRVRILVNSKSGKILLIKSWFGRRYWTIPGGGIARGETPTEAAVRELEEETAIRVRPEELTRIGDLKDFKPLLPHLVVFQVTVHDETLATLATLRRFEIVDRKWFIPTQLPSDTSSLVNWAIEHRH